LSGIKESRGWRGFPGVNVAAGPQWQMDKINGRA